MRSLTLLSILVLLFPACRPLLSELPEETPFTGIHGRVSDPTGHPIAGAAIYAYRNPDSGLRGPADFAAITDADGRYRLELTPGSFHLVARLRRDGGASGPPRPGDAWALPAANPVVLGEQTAYRLDFTLQPIGTQRVMANTLTSAPYRFTGRVLTPQEAPLSDAIVLAYREPDIHRRPDYAAPPTNADGRFTLYLPDPGPWCLVVRQHTRGQLRRSELYALVGKHKATCSLEAAAEFELGAITVNPFRTP